MSKNDTIDDYKKAIKVKFENEKLGSNADFCLNPSPANFKKWCCLVFESKLDLVDEEIFKKFFNWNEIEDKYQKIKSFDIDKFRPFQNFLTKNTEISQLESLNLIAVLIDFKPRPFAKFRMNNLDIEVSKKGSNFTILEKITKSKPEKSINLEDKTQPFLVNFYFRTIVFFIFITMVLGFIIYRNLSEKKCMIWNSNHYISIDCDNLKQGIIQNNPIALDPNDLENFKKINVTKLTVFFKNGQPCVWYGKSFSGKYEFFTSCGLHPETGKTLKPISKYIIDKYVVE